MRTMIAAFWILPLKEYKLIEIHMLYSPILSSAAPTPNTCKVYISDRLEFGPAVDIHIVRGAPMVGLDRESHYLTVYMRQNETTTPRGLWPYTVNGWTEERVVHDASVIMITSSIAVAARLDILKDKLKKRVRFTQ